MDVKALRRVRDDVAAIDAEATTLNEAASAIIEAATGREGDAKALTGNEKEQLKGIKAKKTTLSTKRASLAELAAEAEEQVEAIRAAAAEAVARQAGAAPAPEGPVPAQGRPTHTRQVTAAEDRHVGKFRGIGDYVHAMASTAMAAANRPGYEADQRYLEVEAASGAVSSSVPSDGSSLVQLQYSTILYERAWQQGEIFRRCTFQDIGDGFDGVHLPIVDEKSRAKGSRYGGIDVAWLDDDTAPAQTHPKVDVEEFRLKDIGGMVKIPEKLLRDATALGSYILRALPQEFIYRVEDAIIRGNGKGKPLGILNAPATLTVSKLSGQAAKTIKAKNVTQMWAPFKPLNRTNAAFFVNQEILPELVEMYIATGTSGQLVYMPPGGLSGSPYGTLYGFPVVPIEQASPLGTKGDLILADFSEYLMIRKPGLQMAQSMDFFFDTFNMAIRFKMELNGQPTLKSTITPENADAGFKLSPFVVLETRA